MFSGRPSVPLSDLHASVRASVRPSVIHVVVLFPRYLQYLLTDFRQSFVTGASWDTDDLITFLGQRSQFKVTPSRRRRTALDRRVQLFLVCSYL